MSEGSAECYGRVGPKWIPVEQANMGATKRPTSSRDLSAAKGCKTHNFAFGTHGIAPYHGPRVRASGKPWSKGAGYQWKMMAFSGLSAHELDNLRPQRLEEHCKEVYAAAVLLPTI